MSQKHGNSYKYITPSKRMYLIYLDESGTVAPNDSENFVLAGLIINEDRWFDADKRVKELKEKYFPSKTENIEFHMSEIVNRNEPFREMDESKRAALITEIFQIISKIELRIVFCLIKKKKLLYGPSPRVLSYKYLFERICYQLKDLNIGREPKNYGLLILDSTSKRGDEEVWAGVTRLLRDGTGYETNEFLIEGPVFTESHLRSPMQLADCIAYVINYTNKENQKKNDLIKKSLDEAYKIICTKMPCPSVYHCKIFP